MGRLEPETPEESQARALLELQLGLALERVAPTDGRPTVDYRSPDGGIGVEVKRVTDQSHLESTRDRGNHSVNSTLLKGRWAVMVELTTLSSTLVQVPAFPREDPETVAQLAARGLRVTSNATRETDWRDAHPGPKRKGVRLRGLATDLVPHLEVLERHGKVTTRGLSPFGRPEDLANAVAAILRRTHGALCKCHEPSKGESPGVDVILGYGSVRTGRPETMVSHIELWLGSDLSQNLCDSLANEPSGTERHAVLVFDASTEPEFTSASEQGRSYCPTTPLALPPEVDVLWLIFGPLTCRYDSTNGWTAADSPDTRARSSD